jgi:type I restriction enzyme S subunit
MGSEWQEAQITDLYDISSGLSKPAKDFGSGHPFLAFKDVFNNFFIPDELTQLVQSNEKEQKNGSIRRGDVFLTRTSETMHELGMSSVALKDYDKATFNGFTKRLRPKDSKTLVPEFVGYYLRSPKFRNEMLAFSTMSTRASLNNEMISCLKIAFPSISEQKAIGLTLKKNDDRIELNRRMNETLESMAQALFKSWFVDFDPVIDKVLASGKEIPPEFSERAAVRAALGDKRHPLPEEIRTLFPDEFIDSAELGWIPKGWEVAPLSDITIGLQRGISPKYIDEGGVRVVNQRCIRNHAVDYSLARRNDVTQRKVEGRFLEEGDLLINSTGVGTLGRMAQVHSLSEPTVVDSHVTIARADRDKYMPYTFARMMLSLESYVEAMGEGSTGQTELSRKNLAEVKVTVPPLQIQQFVEEYFYDFSKKASFNSQSTDALRVTRDTLLPKLLSGELRIPDAEKMVEELAL